MPRTRILLLSSLLLPLLLSLPVGAQNAASPGVPAGAAAAPHGAVLVENGPDRIVFEYGLGAWSAEPVDLDGGTYQRIEAPGLDPLGEPGAPALPATSVLLGIPYGSTPRVEVTALAVEERSGMRPVPVPTESFVHVDGEDGQPGFSSPVSRLEPDAAAYSSPVPAPAEWARLGLVSSLRHQRTASVILQPFRYQGADGRLLIATRLRVTVHLEARSTGGREPALPAPAERPEWEALYRSTLLNAEGARTWRRASLPGVSARSSGLMGAPRTTVNPLEYKLKVMKTGFHRVAYGDLSNPPVGTPLADIKVFQREYVGGDSVIVERPSAVRVIDTGEAGIFDDRDDIIFYALSYHDQYVENDWEDVLSDTNVYWLSFEAGAGSPVIGEAPSWMDTATDTAGTFRSEVFAEEDEVNFEYPHRREMDTWYWGAEGDTVAVTFPGIVNSEPVDIAMRMVVNGSLHPDYTSHSVEYRLIEAGAPAHILGTNSLSYNGLPQDFNATIGAPSYLDGQRTFGFQHAHVDDPPDTKTILLDWYRARYTRAYHLESYENTLLFHNGGVTGDVHFTVSGFPTDRIELYRLHEGADPARLIIPPTRIALDAGSGRYTMWFRDTITDSTAYVALDRGAYLKPVRIERQEGALDLVGDPLAPDYLVIAHPDFVAGVAPLADYRTAQGYRVRVASVARVYDVFGNGIPSSQAIKDYIRYAYQHWNAGYVLLVGDGSRDERGLLNDAPSLSDRSSPNYIPTHYEHDQNNDPDYTLRAYDNWYADLSQPLDWISEVSVGRFPVGSPGELAAMIEKTMTYEAATQEEDWRRRVLFLADDEYTWEDLTEPDCWTSSQLPFRTSSEWMADTIDASAAGRSESVPMYLADYTDLYDPEHHCHESGCCVNRTGMQAYALDVITPQLVNRLNDGVLIWNYQGHANRNVLTHEYVWLESGFRSDSHKLANRQRPFLFLGYACYISMFDYRREPQFGDGLGEKMLLWPEGGAAAVYASPGLELLSPNTVLNRHLTDYMWSASTTPGGDAGLVLGPAVTAGVVRYLAEQPSAGDRVRAYHVLGDPALRVDIGPPHMRVMVGDSLAVDGTHIAEYITDPEDTVATVTAQISDEGGVTGITLRKEAPGGTTVLVPGVDYTVEALVDSGAVNPRRQRLTYDVPLSFESFDLVMHAEDLTGHASEFTLVSGLSVSVEVDGLVIQTGAEVAPRPEFRAIIVSPVPVLGTDLGLRIDGEMRTDVVREAPEGESTPGSSNRWDLLVGPLDLSLSDHTIEVTHEQGGAAVVVASIAFRVRADVDIVYSFCYPNPFGERTALVFRISPLPREVQADIYTVAGRKVRTLRMESFASDQNQMMWDGCDGRGDPVASGVYLVRMKATSTVGVQTTAMDRVVKITGR